MYKMEVYRAEEKTLFRTEKSNNLESGTVNIIYKEA